MKKKNYVVSCNTPFIHNHSGFFSCGNMNTLNFSKEGLSYPHLTPNLEYQVPYLYSLGQGSLDIPWHWVLIAVASYDTYGLRWNYSIPQSPHGKINVTWSLKTFSIKIMKIGVESKDVSSRLCICMCVL